MPAQVLGSPSLLPFPSVHKSHCAHASLHTPGPEHQRGRKPVSTQTASCEASAAGLTSRKEALTLQAKSRAAEQVGAQDKEEGQVRAQYTPSVTQAHTAGGSWEPRPSRAASGNNFNCPPSQSLSLSDKDGDFVLQSVHESLLPPH